MRNRLKSIIAIVFAVVMCENVCAQETQIDSAKFEFLLGVESYIEQDYIRAAYYFTKSAKQGLVDAQYMLGVCYAEGDGVVQDYKQAVYWYTKAAEQGLAEAQYNLALKYANGEGVVQDYKQAVYWAKKAAEQGIAEAQYILGVCYYE
ncbi:MAG: sel1 repeat family protein, partial [Bacteroidales bacterium]|nr:sel1 repeat family protein [Bacteroidales bacterium]